MASRGKTVAELAGVVGGRVVPGSKTSGGSIVDVTHDSRQVRPGFVFVALRGVSFDGHDFVHAAVRGGASALCVESPAEVDIGQIVVSDTRRALGPLAATVHDHPSSNVDVAGVTGTDGKTTVTHYLASLTETAGKKPGLIGTIEARIGDRRVESVHTTPEASDFQRLLAEMRDAGVDLVAAEISSHALELGRVSATSFEVAAFTNLSQDHLDFHGDMESYRRAKQRLFREYEVGTAVLNIADPTGRLIAEEFEGDTITVGDEGDIRFGALRSTLAGTVFDLATPWGKAEVTAPVVGSFNVENAVMAASCALATGFDFETVVRGLHQLSGVPGRFEVVSGDDPIVVVVDYAHTPEGVTAAIAAARTTTRGRVIALIGAGGDRDREKRPLMGAAVTGADLAVVTSDNPRSEDPEEILAAVLSGVPSGASVVSEVDRSAAIGHAVRSARDGDTVLVLGRGHEPYQAIGDSRVPFDDRMVAAEALAARRSAESGHQSGSMTR